MKRFLLKEAFNQYFQMGCKTHTKHQLLVYGAHDRNRINACLGDWKLRGLVQVVKPLEEADESDIVVKVLNLVDPERN